MPHTRTNFLATLAGFLLMLFGLAHSLITVIGSSYRSVLLTALTSTLLALACLSIPIIRGPTRWRIAALLIASPALYTLCDFANRAPYAFGAR